MQKRDSNGLTFALESSLVSLAIVLLTITVVAAENYATNGHTLAAAEIANDSSFGSIATPLHFPK
jgi:hypothetical protein